MRLFSMREDFEPPTMHVVIYLLTLVIYIKSASVSSDEGEASTEYASLKNFLETYTDKMQAFKNQETQLDGYEREGEPKSKSWNLLHLSRPSSSYDNKKGWVSLEAVPWSVSKISKWHSHHKPSSITSNSWNDDGDDNDRWYQKPTTPSYTNFCDKPNFQHGHKPNPRPVDPPVGISNFQQHTSGINYNKKMPYHQDPYTDIITDGQPPNFPEANRRQSSPDDQHLPVTHPFEGDGEWILLSTTKGYKYPKYRERSMHITGDSVSTHRSVHLTVLPPAKNSNVNMTTSHGGLLEVESTFQSVDQAQKDYVRKQRAKQTRRHIKRPVKNLNIGSSQNLVKVPAKPLQQNKIDSSAVLAAVGAGMIPATMAMLVPMAMGGKRRRRRNLDITDLPVTITEFI